MSQYQFLNKYFYINKKRYRYAPFLPQNICMMEDDCFVTISTNLSIRIFVNYFEI